MEVGSMGGGNKLKEDKTLVLVLSLKTETLYKK